MDTSALVHVWAGIIAVAILVYVLLDGFDLGVGILFGTTRDEAKRGPMMEAIAPFWDGNETWLVVIGASLFAAFPVVYAVFLSAFYLPVLLLLVGLIFRGVAFEFRYRSERMRGFWDFGFAAGSTISAFVQGAAVGAMMRGIPVEDGQFAGTALDWLHPFPVLTGFGLVLGYAMLGGGWLALKTEGPLADWARARVLHLVIAVAVVAGLAVVLALTVDISPGLAEAATRFGTLSWSGAIVGAGALALNYLSARQGRNAALYPLAALFFFAAYVALAGMMWPYMIPYALTVRDAAAPEASLRFMLFAGIVVLPIVATYTIGVYWLFRGKVDSAGKS
jgi:cytochrome bd ubiquinol oxidase subunit II